MLGRTFLGHGGAYFGGWNSLFLVLPEENVAIVQHMNIMLGEPTPVFARVVAAALGTPAPVMGAAPDEPLLESAPGVYELTMPGPLTNFRPATGIGRITIERDGGGLRATTRWGHWKGGAPLRPADPADPNFMVLERPDAEPFPLVFTRGADGRVGGLWCNRLVRMNRRPIES
jgi:hypothetical protein